MARHLTFKKGLGIVPTQAVKTFRSQIMAFGNAITLVLLVLVLVLRPEAVRS
jgi:hypothetical protein